MEGWVHTGQDQRLIDYLEHTLVPLTDMGTDLLYKGESGGLYGSGRNDPPAQLRRDAKAAALGICPRDVNGKPTPDGKIGFLSVGLSNACWEFGDLMRRAAECDDVAPELCFVNGAQSGMDAANWATDALEPKPEGVWQTVTQRTADAGLHPAQLQVAWVKLALRAPARFGEFPEHTKVLARHLGVVVSQLALRFPSLRLAYLSSRIFGGYANVDLNPEPYAFESAFAVRRLIEAQQAGAPGFNPDPAKGPVRAPLLVWGPYLWARGARGRASDDLVWTPGDMRLDGTHPSRRGACKVAEQLLSFFRLNETSRGWFLARSASDKLDRSTTSCL